MTRSPTSRVRRASADASEGGGQGLTLLAALQDLPGQAAVWPASRRVFDLVRNQADPARHRRPEKRLRRSRRCSASMTSGWFPTPARAPSSATCRCGRCPAMAAASNRRRPTQRAAHGPYPPARSPTSPPPAATLEEPLAAARADIATTHSYQDPASTAAPRSQNPPVSAHGPERLLGPAPGLLSDPQFSATCKRTLPLGLIGT